MLDIIMLLMFSCCLEIPEIRSDYGLELEAEGVKQV